MGTGYNGNGGGGCYDWCHDGPTALEYGKLTSGGCSKGGGKAVWEIVGTG